MYELNLTLQQLVALPRNVPVPDKMIPRPEPNYHHAQWRGLPHNEVVATVMEACQERDWVPQQPQCWTDRRCLDCCAFLDIHIPYLGIMEGTVMCLGILNSNRGRFRGKLVGGMRLLGNHATIAFTSYPLAEHRGTVQQIDRKLGQRVDAALDQYARDCQRFPGEVMHLARKSIDPHRVNLLLNQAARKGMIPWSHIAQVDEVFWQGKPTCWHLLRAVASALRLRNPMRRMTDALNFYLMLREDQA